MPGDHRGGGTPTNSEGRLTRRRRIRLSFDTRRWLKKEISYLSERNPAAAQRISAAFVAAWDRIARFPEIGPKADLPATRRVVVGAYIVTIRVVDEVVEIVAIRHGRQADARAPTDLGAADDPDPT
jgi:toxin ParE1/3/4